MDLKLFQGTASGDSSSSRSSYSRPGSHHSQNQGPIPKNYFHIFNNELPRVDLMRYNEKASGKYYGKLFISITPVQDMFIGMGEIGRTSGSLYDMFSYRTVQKDIKTWNIPGSSLKGCIFAHLYMFLATDPKDNHHFNRTDLPARVFFSDLPFAAGQEPILKDISARFEPNSKVTPLNAVLKLYKKEYQNDSTFQGEPGKEKIQAIKAGSKFEGYVHFKDLNEYEIAMLILAFGSFPDHSFLFKIGGAKNRGMGLVRFRVDFEKSIYASSLKEIFESKTLPLTKFKDKLIQSFLRIKQDYSCVERMIKRMQEEYGQ